ncbi:putative serine/threonine-protein kinase [Trypanosoma rangeli]|uniref:non-specific serine/threonine protein kinase n=1 Tax=Trypanosoma rangeli TaxID=5698 RepID=A0A3R7M6Z7_TRYRA|nr:putative serine/threonine-protein kinase [Trypanosoma rangeli]RNE97317.1 putative serine/threonine-protein kinase [Trypanosoma rangeli]|eukprot:RNE97317.1 putative serine/threonine-protein kinase [Trypanosoma rangeli]
MENYVPIRVLGKGSFGSAWLVQRRSDRVQFVAKEVRLLGMKPGERESAKHEIDVLRTLNHPNITRYVDHYERNGSLYIVMEYANGGDLYTKIRSRKGARFTEREILHYFSQLCLALLHLHERHILHRDLKTQNVFLTKDGVIKLGDFGISAVLRNTFELRRTVCGTPYYFSPELCLNKPYNNKSDVWALGCILYELTTLTHAFDGNNMKALVQKILKGMYPPIHSSYSQNLSTLISTMLQIDPRLRPNVSQLILLPYIRDSLSSLQRAVQVAHHDHKPFGPQGGKEEPVHPPSPPSSPQERMQQAEDRRRDEQAKTMKLARERQQLRQQLEQRQRENEERLRQIQVHQRQAEIERNQRKKELEARIREQRREAEKRAKAHAIVYKQREEEWERNLREQVEEYKHRQREEERLARERAGQGALRERLLKNDPTNNNNEKCNGDLEMHAPAVSANAVELYREMRRQAALNKQRVLEDMRGLPERVDPPVVSVAEGMKHVPQALLEPSPHARQHHINSLGKMEPAEAEEVRRQVYWQMRREAQENKRRVLGLEEALGVALPKHLAPLPHPPQVAPQQEPRQEQQREQHQEAPPPPQQEQEQEQRQPLEESAEEGEVVVCARPLVENGAPCAPTPSTAAEEEPGCTSANGETATPEGDSAGKKRDEDYSALQTAIDAALTQEEQRAEVKDFNDEAFFDADPSKFMLDGQTLVLPNVQATDPLMHRIESLRLFLEGQLGESALIASYRQMNNITADDDEAMQRVADMLPEEKQKFIPLIGQLIVCEDAFNRQLLQ